MNPSWWEWLPVAVLGVPLLFSIPVAAGPAAARKPLWVAGSAVTLLLASLQAARVASAGAITALGGEVVVDGLGAIMTLLIAGIAFVCSLYALAYLPGPHAREPERRRQLEARMPLFITLFLILEFTLIWVVTTNNIVLLWVAIEATTLASALLVSFYWDARSLEAGYKYLLLLTVGITSAFFGCVLLYAAAAPHLGEHSALLLTNLRAVAGQLPPQLVLFAALLLTIGFGTKAGLVPFHPWVADAHAEAPAVMSAFLSSVIIEAPLVGLMRVWSVLGPHQPLLGELLLWIGALTMVLGAVLAAAQDDLKRLLAYSSVSQVGYIAVAIGIGPPFGYYAAIFFLVSHALIKGLLFLTTGAVGYAARDLRSIAALGGLKRRMPITAAGALIGALALGGMPPFSGFMAKVQVIAAAASARSWVVLGVAVAASLITLTYTISMVQGVFLGRPHTEPAIAEAREVPATMVAAMLILMVAIVALGLRPQLLDPWLAMVAGMR